MRIKLPAGVWTPLNQGKETKFLVQNVGQASIYLAVQSAAPAPEQSFDLVLEPLCGMTDAHFNQTIWARPMGKVVGTVGVVL